MRKIALDLSAKTPHSYPIFVGSGASERLAEHLPAGRVAIVSDATVDSLYGARVEKTLIDAGRSVSRFSFPAGEASKCFSQYEALMNDLLSARFGRDTVIVALGGGVSGDLAGFLAATLMRGVPFVQVPTSFLAMVDSSVGGKTGIDSPFGKNLIGAFWQPSAVIAETDFLATLPDAELKNGAVEAAKMFLTSDKTAFGAMNRDLDRLFARDEAILEETILAAIEVKASVVSRDETERGERAVLNFGHTVGHALEALSDFALPHGHAVALGIIIENRIARLLGTLSSDDEATIFSFLQRFSFDLSPIFSYDPNTILDAMRSDKKNLDGKIRFSLLSGIGQSVRDGDAWAHFVDDAIILDSIQSFQ